MSYDIDNFLKEIETRSSELNEPLDLWKEIFKENSKGFINFIVNRPLSEIYTEVTSHHMEGGFLLEDKVLEGDPLLIPFPNKKSLITIKSVDKNGLFEVNHYLRSEYDIVPNEWELKSSVVIKDEYYLLLNLQLLKTKENYIEDLSNRNDALNNILNTISDPIIFSDIEDY